MSIIGNMTKAAIFILNLDDTLTFNPDDALPLDLSDQSFKVTAVRTALLNDVYFDNGIFCSYELTAPDGQKIFLTPFHFEEEVEMKLRISKVLPSSALSQLKIESNALAAENYISINE